MGKVKVGLYYYLIADILTKVLHRCSLSSPLPNMNFVQTSEFDWLPWQLKGQICEKNIKKSPPGKP